MDIRWQQRYQNFIKAHTQFQRALLALTENPEESLIQMAVIQAFEFTYELGWKTVKDLLNYNGIKANLPRDIIKEGFAFGLLEDGQVWIDMLEDRNLMSHAYDESISKKVIHNIQSRYAKAIDSLHHVLSSKLDQ